MAADKTMHRTQLPKIFNDGTNNNFREWQTKSFHRFREWDLLKYLEGPTSEPPFIPPLRQTISHTRIDDDGRETTIHIQGNQTKHQQALTNAEPWMPGNNTALS
jgi:hypothetical protein